MEETIAIRHYNRRGDIEYISIYKSPVICPHCKLTMIPELEFIDKRTTILSGNFFGYGDCVIAVHSLAYQNLVCGTVVVFPTKNKWSQLYSNYASVKNGLIRKYGIPSECTEKFTGRYEPTSDSEKIYFVHHDRCNYSTSFTTKNGSITVSISCLHDNEANVLIGYYDKINAKKEADESDDDL